MGSEVEGFYGQWLLNLLMVSLAGLINPKYRWSYKPRYKCSSISLRIPRQDLLKIKVSIIMMGCFQ